MNLVTQFGYTKIVNLDFFVENLKIQPLINDNFNYIRSLQVGFSAFYDEQDYADTYMKVNPTVRQFEVVGSIKQGIIEDIRENVERKGEANSVNNILLDYTENLGEATHLVMMPNKLVMPVNFDDFRVKVFGNKYAFCWFNQKRFFCYQYDLDKYLKEIGA